MCPQICFLYNDVAICLRNLSMEVLASRIIAVLYSVFGLLVTDASTRVISIANRLMLWQCQC